MNRRLDVSEKAVDKLQRMNQVSPAALTKNEFCDVAILIAHYPFIYRIARGGVKASVPIANISGCHKVKWIIPFLAMKVVPDSYQCIPLDKTCGIFRG